MVEVDREIVLLFGQICTGPAIRWKRLCYAGSKVHGTAKRRRLKCDGNSIGDIRGIWTGNGWKRRKTRRTVRRKRHGARSCGKVGWDLRRRTDKISEVDKAVDTGQNDADGCEARPQHEIPNMIHVGAETDEVFSTDPGHGIGTLVSCLVDFVEDAEVVSQKQFIGNVEIGLASHPGKVVVAARILA